MVKPHILIVEDEPFVSQMIGHALCNYQLSYAYDGNQAIRSILDLPPDLITLDLQLPGASGYQIAAYLRSKGSHIPIIMITGTMSVEGEVIGLQSGCDDYIRKPFTKDILLARVEALLRRARFRQEEASAYSFGDLTINTQTRAVSRAGRKISLTPKEYQLLEYFLEHKQRVLTRRQLLIRVWEDENSNESNVLDVTLAHLREKLGKPALVHTIRGYGFILQYQEGMQ